MRSWVIGSRADCDVVVDSPVASGRHCQLMQGRQGFLLEDLGSTNGTYVDGDRITRATPVSPGQAITLGQTVSMPWPPEVATFIRIGRVTGNDIVLDDPRVSSRHARLMIVFGFDALIEDVGSSNGTFLNSAENRLTRPTPLTKSDTVYFGSLAVPAAQLLAGRIGSVAPVSVPKTQSASEPPTKLIAAMPPTEPIARAPAVGFMKGNRWLLASLAQGPVLAFLIVLVLGNQASPAVTAASWASVGQRIASASFALALAALWLGFFFAVAELASGQWPRRREEADPATILVFLGSRIAVLVAGCAVGCGLLLAIVYWGIGFKGPGLAIWAILVLASTVGLLLGLLVCALGKTWQTVTVFLVLTFVPMAALSGWLWPLSGKNLALRMAAAALPARWAFEGVLLLESPHHSPPANPDGPVPTQDRDLAEDFFPADSLRMGPRADAMALGSMLIGMAAAVALLAGKPQ